MRYIKKVNLIFLIVLSTLVISCKSKKEIKTDPIRVTTEKVTKSDFVKKINLIGEIEAEQSVDIFPKVLGKIISYEFEDGTKVSENTFIKKDQVFAILDHEDLDINLKRAESNLEMANANLDISSLTLEEAIKDNTRMQNLYEKRSLSEKQMEMSISNKKKMQALHEQALARVKDAKASYDQAKNMLDRAFIKSPIDGVLTKKYISENNMANPTRAIVNISNLDELKILAPIPEKVISLINKNTSIDLKVDSYPNSSFKAEILQVHPTIDKMSRMGTLELKIAKNSLLKPGMYTNIEMNLTKENKIIKVPFSSLIYHDGSYRAYVYKDGKAHLKQISIGDRNDNFVEVLSGIEEDDNLIVLGQNKLTDQIEVNPTIENLGAQNENN